ncbi:GNAT family N-acetyltransferase [Radiobacillus kanasensis]|uniref:GNAT family N-acetyltransferase n=1 Tax=Radiobacillus kanasensis TaxID=2844358 RepID=UPI001E285A9F|nr:GNAT family N-acetyltransferase [Radiobacillus kanasensis]UFU00488.1 GNAT family N-acetyltransferase [Radiobacillus kanasensis]
MIIREALEQELPFVRKQRVRAYEEHAGSVKEDHWLALKKAVSSEADRGPGVEVLVAEVDNQIVGSVVLFPAYTDAYEGQVEEVDYPEIRMLSVSPEARGRGIASELIKECIQRSKEKGHTHIGLHTGSFMTGAMKLYEGFGFERLPEYDFEPANDGIVVRAYRLKL